MCEINDDAELSFVDFLEDNEEESLRLKCGEVLFVNSKEICFRCCYCEKEIQNVEMFLRHIFEYHLILPGDDVVEEPTNTNSKGHLIKKEQEDDQEFVDIKIDKFAVDVEFQKDQHVGNNTVDDLLKIEDITQESNDDSFKDQEEEWISFQSIKKKKQQSTIKKSKQIENKLHVCEYCAATFKDRSNLSEHIKRHLGIKPHRCTLCGKSFTSSPELRMHIRSHTGEKPYECDECDKKYAHPYRLLAHRRRHKNERPYKCKSCDKSFFENQRLRDHEVAHRDERPFSCDTCGSNFKRKSDLKTHSKIHLDIKTYTCEICNKSYAQYAGLYSHMKQHQTSKPIS